MTNITFLIPQQLRNTISQQKVFPISIFVGITIKAMKQHMIVLYPVDKMIVMGGIMGITNTGGAKLESTDQTFEIEELKREISLLPTGGIATKKIRGKVYYYHRVTVNGKRSETYIDFDKVENCAQRSKSVRNLRPI